MLIVYTQAQSFAKAGALPPVPSRVRGRWSNAGGALLVALALVSLSSPAEAQWRWRDATGRVNVSDRPPPREVPEKDILSRPANSAQRKPTALPVADGASAAASAAISGAPGASGAATGPAASAPAPGGLQAEVEARRKRAEQERAARTKAEEERLAGQRAENCRRARSHVTTLESGQRMARVNERGEREVLDDSARAEELRAARAVITSDCR